MKTKNINKRWFLLAVGVISMLFAGVLYAWSILKVPFREEVGFTSGQLAFSYTLTMCFFCLGGFLSGQIIRRISTRPTILIAGTLAGTGIALAGILAPLAPFWLFFSYAFLAGLGIGMAYIAIISTVNAYFPDRKGLSSGVLMMGFGASTLILGKLAARLFASPLGWKNTYVLLGAVIGIVLILSAFFITPPDPDTVFPAPKRKSSVREEVFEERDYTPSEMIRRFTFWRAFLSLVCFTAVGSSVISFANDLALSVGATAGFATTLVGVLAVCNGLGRILTGAVFDTMGRRFTMIGATVLTTVAATVTLVSVVTSSLPLCVVGLCLTGLSYGTSPTVSSAFTLAFYGKKYFASNLSISNFNLMGASFIATACAALQTSSGGYVIPFALLLALSVVAILLNLTVKKP
ncbi:MAG: OFA family MFS transporter [Ruminococcaceae bacterium]|nr:OFA family MFS transporter [Oscillospiraceae bacterium]